MAFDVRKSRIARYHGKLSLTYELRVFEYMQGVTRLRGSGGNFWLMSFGV